MALADFAAGRWDARRTIQWRLVFGIWALLAAAIGYVRANEFPVWVGVAIVLLYALWLQGMDRRNTADREITWNAINAAHAILLREQIDIVPPKPAVLVRASRSQFHRDNLSFLGDWSTRIELSFTVGLLMLFYAISVQHPTWWYFGAVAIKK
jgi:hypothetical protein